MVEEFSLLFSLHLQDKNLFHPEDGRNMFFRNAGSRVHGLLPVQTMVTTRKEFCATFSIPLGTFSSMLGHIMEVGI
jgi:hypothetical protein